MSRRTQPANGVRFDADHDFTPDHRTVAFKAGETYPLDQVREIFAVDSVDELRQALALYGVPAEIVGA